MQILKYEALETDNRGILNLSKSIFIQILFFK